MNNNTQVAPFPQELADLMPALWDWAKFRGSAEGLKWNRKELPVVELVLQHVERKRVVVQAGGNLGIFPKYLAQQFDVVYTFEPEPELFEMMVYNASEKNIVKFQAALGYKRELVKMSRQRRQNDGGNSHEGITHVSGPGIIPTICIDDLALPVCDLLYLDVEGYELFALRGARETIERCRPVIACEINKSLDHMGTICAEDVRACIRVLGYDHIGRIRSDEVFVPR